MLGNALSIAHMAEVAPTPTTTDPFKAFGEKVRDFFAAPTKDDEIYEVEGYHFHLTVIVYADMERKWIKLSQYEDINGKREEISHDRYYGPKVKHTRKTFRTATTQPSLTVTLDIGTFKLRFNPNHTKEQDEKTVADVFAALKHVRH
jgi:hypothetical protein